MVLQPSTEIEGENPTKMPISTPRDTNKASPTIL